MERGDIVEVIAPDWAALWHGAVGVVIRIDRYVHFRPLTYPMDTALDKKRWADPKELAGFLAENLRVLGHIELPPE